MNTIAPSNQFFIPDHLNASLPPEALGKRRSDIKMLVLNANNQQTNHFKFNDLVSLFESGDVLVFNNSRTIPAVLNGSLNHKKVEIRLSRKLSDAKWEALILAEDFEDGDIISFPNRVTAVINKKTESILSTLLFSIKGNQLLDFIYKNGKPIRYEYITKPLPLEFYQTVYSSVPGSVEMCSAGRAFTWEMLHQLKSKGVKLAFLQLHTGLSYYGNDQWPEPNKHPEWYHIPTETAEIINRAHKEKKRVIAVGTTVVRALESSISNHKVGSSSGWTTIYINKHSTIQSVTGLITGFHEPEASHLDLLTAFISEDYLIKSYNEAIDKGYQWHEFGDLNLILHDGNS
ncbi:S-adenosylmethionine:tRNA ribosyltransferase-isomerase [Litchfieldia alkalitelluris]|uniref:S-adenosylmethionine:tRNA ribosyltransferase-isomerase n=1 Tax=Litchfieldia alkalitelluris TaxID=304268 RepID=UPI000998D70F|nr:S-adenosylmethionine:tRNA ribosyltransferase-isomerase [Litchfieldia alkalitelluris]